MDNLIKILIVEDNAIIATDLQILLEEMGYVVVGQAVSYEEAIPILTSEDIDLALLDINLDTEKTGIDIGRYIRANLNIPFVFVTSNSDKPTIDKAKEVKPNGYLVKPYEKSDLYTTIEITLSNFNEQNQQIKKSKNALLKDSMFVKKNHLYFKLAYKDILYVEEIRDNIEIHTKESLNYMVNTSIDAFFKKLPEGIFYKVSNTVLVNINHIEAVNERDVIINQRMIPISSEFSDFMMDLLGP